MRAEWADQSLESSCCRPFEHLLPATASTWGHGDVNDDWRHMDRRVSHEYCALNVGAGRLGCADAVEGNRFQREEEQSLLLKSLAKGTLNPTVPFKYEILEVQDSTGMCDD